MSRGAQYFEVTFWNILKFNYHYYINSIFSSLKFYSVKLMCVLLLGFRVICQTTNREKQNVMGQGLILFQG